MTINLHIESIVLEGIDISRRERPLLQEAIQSELSQLLATQGCSPGTLAQAHLTTNPIQLADQSEPIQLGQQIATSVFQGINQ